MRRVTHTAAKAVVAGALLCAACAGAACTPRAATPSAPVSVPAPGPAPAVSGTGAVSLDALQVTLTPEASGLVQPVFVTNAGDGSNRLFVVEQGGRIRVIRNGHTQPGAFLDVSKRISTGGERGLLGLAFAPDYTTSGILYIDYTDAHGDTVVARFTAGDPSSDSPQLTGPEEVLAVAQPFANHNGGCLMFEPGTSRLWVGMGDGGSGGDPGNRAQNPGQLLGKMLVLDFSASAKPKPQVVERGVRNPWRFSFDRKTHDLWIGDVGQDAWEEIDFVPLGQASGVNWGWHLWEGTYPYPSDANPSKQGFMFPITEYGHDRGQSVTGGFVYRGSENPALVGTYLYADFEAGWITGLQRTAPDGSVLARPLERTVIESVGNPSSFGEDEAGEVYVCEWGGGTLYKVGAKQVP